MKNKKDVIIENEKYYKEKFKNPGNSSRVSNKLTRENTAYREQIRKVSELK